MAQLYNKGEILPQDDLSAYKWAFISALNGNKEAEQFTLSLEQFLSTSDLEATGPAIQTARLKIQENMQKKIEELKKQTEALTVQNVRGVPKNGHAPLPTSIANIFSDKDHF